MLELSLDSHGLSILYVQNPTDVQSTNSLYTEVETLAKLSDTLTAQLSSKSFDMREADNRMARLATEKAKADNKYFQAMRTKEATEAECRTAQRSVEKQARLLEKALEVEKALQGQVAAQEKALTGMKNELVDLQGKWVREQEGARVGEMRLSQAQASLAEVSFGSSCVFRFSVCMVWVVGDFIGLRKVGDWRQVLQWHRNRIPSRCNYKARDSSLCHNALAGDVNRASAERGHTPDKFGVSCKTRMIADIHRQTASCSSASQMPRPNGPNGYATKKKRNAPLRRWPS